jgi:hypothetical protein
MISKETQKFYRKVSGSTFAKTGNDNQPGINGALMETTPCQGIVTTIDLPAIEEFSKIQSKMDGNR